MYALLDFKNYRIVQRNKYSKVKIYDKEENEKEIDLFELKNSIKEHFYQSIIEFLKCKINEYNFQYKENLQRVKI